MTCTAGKQQPWVRLHSESPGALSLNRRRLKRTTVTLQAECRRRAQAEAITLTQRRLARFSKERGLAAMATGIAHEINQPLIAIQNYAQAAKRRVHSDPAQTAKLDELFDKIEQQSGRAGDIIQHIRKLVTTGSICRLKRRDRTWRSLAR
jgi:phosphoglycerate-specific signal transduction histidine kinase